MLYSGLLSLSLISTALAAAVAGKSSFKLKDEIAVPHGWSQTHERIEKSKLMDLRIGLVQQNIDEAQSMLHEISNPRHRKYGRYLSKAEIRELLAPSAESVDKVMDWLTNHHKIAKHNIAQVGDFIHCKVSVATAEKMLDTEYNMYHSKGKKVARALHYSLPYDLHDHIELVQPTTMFGSMHAHAKDLIRIDGSAYRTAARLPVFRRADASYNVSISSLRSLYNIGNYTVQNNSTSISIASYLEQYANMQDYDTFLSTNVPYMNPNGTFTVTSINGGQNLQNLSLAGDEANLDTQYAFGLVGDVAQKTTFVTGGRPPFYDDNQLNGTNTNEPYLDFVTYLLADNYTDPLPQVISTSYGDDEQTVPKDYALRVCRGFMSLGLMGTSVIFSSGDSGVGPGGNVSSDLCQGNIPGTPEYNKTIFLPAFPASCPYVTVVGGTTRQNPEVAVEILDSSNTTENGFFSGGGFSNYFARPSYQNAQVEPYLQTINSTYLANGFYNPAGRGYPDVATQSWRFAVYVNGTAGRIGGTSASSPTFAGIVALLNDARTTQGLPVLGFLNPMLYSLQNVSAANTTGSFNGTGLNDITIGSNPGCGTNGFNTSVGWDAVTGLGSPNFAVLLAQLTGNTTLGGFLQI